MWRVLRRVVGGATDATRGLTRSLPRPVRGRLRDFAVWSDRWRPAPQIEDWSRPLTGANRDSVVAVSFGGLDVVEPVPSQDSVGPTHADVAPLRCLLVTSQLDVGGTDEMVAFLARRLPTHRLQTAVLHATSNPAGTGEPRGRLGRMLRASGIEVHEADEISGPGWIEQWGPEVISAHAAPDWVLAFAQSNGVPYVDTLHGMNDLFGANWRVEAVRGAKLSAIVTVSELLRQQYLARNRDFPPGRIIPIPNGVDDERRRPGDRIAARDRLGLTDQYLFVSLARHSPEKNAYGLITAFADMARSCREAHLVIAGRANDTRYYRHMLQLRDGLPCRDRIHLRDHVAAPAELLAAADGFVLDSFFEGGPLVSMEALCAGVPVVLSDVGAAREQVGSDPARGYLVANPLGDPLRVDWEAVGAARYRSQYNRGEFAAAMEDLVADRQDYLRDRERLAAESASRFNAAACLDRHAALLRAVATGADPPKAGDVRLPGLRTPSSRQATYPSAARAQRGSCSAWPLSTTSQGATGLYGIRSAHLTRWIGAKWPSCRTLPAPQ